MTTVSDVFKESFKDTFKDSGLTIDQDALRRAMPPEVVAAALESLQKAVALKYLQKAKEDEHGSGNDSGAQQF